MTFLQNFMNPIKVVISIRLSKKLDIHIHIDIVKLLIPSKFESCHIVAIMLNNTFNYISENHIIHFMGLPAVVFYME